MDVMPNIIVDTIMCTIIFVAFYLIYPIAMKRFYYKWYTSLNKRKRVELPAYVVCLLHHFFMVPRGWIHIYNDYMLTSNDVDYATVEATIAPFSLGYLFADTLCYAIPQLLYTRNVEYLIHHMLAVSLVIAGMFAPGSLNRFIPHLLICDTTNIFFNVAWLCRAAGFQGSTVVTCLEVSFALSFFFIRGIHLPIAFVALANSEESMFLGFAKNTLLPIVLMQWYWLAKILSTLVNRISKKSIKNGDY
jgi:hypothetical protein